MKSIRTPARRGCFAAVAATAIIAFATQALCADEDARSGKWAGELHTVVKGQQAAGLGTPVEFEWVTSDPARKDNSLQFYGKKSCRLSAQYVGQGDEGYHFVLQGTPGGHCDKADYADLKPEAGGMRLTVGSDDAQTLHEQGALHRKEGAAKPATQ